MKARLIGTPERTIMIEEAVPSGLGVYRVVVLSGEAEFSDGKRYCYHWEVGTQHASLTKTVIKRKLLKRTPYSSTHSVRVEATGKSRRQSLVEALNEYEIYWASLDE